MKVKEIVLTHEIAEGKEPWPEEVLSFEIEGTVTDTDNPEAPSLSEDGSIEWDITSEDQPTLFD